MVLSYMFGISRRYEMIIMIVTAATISYTYRVNISVAVPDMKEQFQWSEDQRGLILSSFFWGYAAGQVPFSKLAQYIGAKPIVMMSIFVPGALGFLFPYIARESFPAALFARVLIGLFSSGLYPSVYHLFPHWIPPDESTVLVPLATCGNYFGEIIGFAVSGWLIGFCNWSVLFYVFGVAGVLWCPVWWLVAAETPQEHRYISAEELRLFEKNEGTFINLKFSH